MTPRDAVVAFWNTLETAAIPELLDPDFTFRGSLGSTMTGYAAFADYVGMVTGALGDYRCTILELVWEDDRAFARMQFEGIHRGLFQGFAPTGRPVDWSGAALFMLKAGKIADSWVQGDVQGT